MCMNKKILKLLLFIFCIFFNLNVVSAKTCAQIDQDINKYNEVKEKLSSLDCSKVDDTKIVNECNKYNLEKNTVLSEIYRINEAKPNCSSQVTKMESILKENENNCGKIFDDTIDKWIKYIMGIFYIIGPILVIVFGTLDFGKATISSDSTALKKATNKFYKRLLALVLLFLSPLLTNLIISINTTGYNLSGDAYSCNYSTIWARKNIQITKVAKSEDENDAVSGGGGSNPSTDTTSEVSGKFLKWKQYEGAWKNINIGCGTVRKCGCLLTSVSIQIANSGTAKKASFTPTTFINAVKNNNGLTSSGLFTWTGWSKIAPKFEYVGQQTLTGSQAQKANQLKKYLEQGYYPVAEVKAGGCGQHWVAVMSVKGSEITIADPGSTKTKLNGSTYSCFPGSNHQVALFKIKGK